MPVFRAPRRFTVDETLYHDTADVPAAVVGRHHRGYVEAVPVQVFEQIQLPLDRRHGARRSPHHEALTASFDAKP